MNREIESIDITREEFDTYISNPNIPVLLNDNPQDIANSLKNIGGEVVSGETLYELKHKLNKKRVENRNKKIEEQKLLLKSRKQQDIQDIIEVFETISNK